MPHNLKPGSARIARANSVRSSSESSAIRTRMVFWFIREPAAIECLSYDDSAAEENRRLVGLKAISPCFLVEQHTRKLSATKWQLKRRRANESVDAFAFIRYVSQNLCWDATKGAIGPRWYVRLLGYFVAAARSFETCKTKVQYHHCRVFTGHFSFRNCPTFTLCHSAMRILAPRGGF